MAKSKNTTKEKVKNEPLVEVKEEKKESALYFFYTTGCGWCNKAMPFIDELNKEGYEILKLDLADGDNRKLQDEVKDVRVSSRLSDSPACIISDEGLSSTYL